MAEAVISYQLSVGQNAVAARQNPGRRIVRQDTYKRRPTILKTDN